MFDFFDFKRFIYRDLLVCHKNGFLFRNQQVEIHKKRTFLEDRLILVLKKTLFFQVPALGIFEVFFQDCYASKWYRITKLARMYVSQ